MSLFQKSVINKYLKTLNLTEVENSFLKFREFYADKERIENIRLLKEENYQEGFLRELFVQVLDYTINPDKNYNLTTEFKNLTDAKKADGAILDDGKAIGVIELKSTKTHSLELITEQAFNYKNHQPDCRYIITSNFEKIRFYIDNATDFEDFNLFTLSKDDFKILYLILSKESIFNEIPLKLKKESVLHEENISKQLYQDYSNFKRKIFENLVKNNPQYDKLKLFKKSQKLLDRFLFILFGEDSGLVPPNAISKIIDQWKTFSELDEPVTLYSRFTKLFHHLDVGHKYKTFEIPAYNGGLFLKDEILDNFQIDDKILLNDSLKLSSYDFQTEIDVNILGHIFENSLNEIEEITAELEGKAVDKKKTKRKKEGIFYTPKYITKYIVENTVGELCNQKKKELNLDKIDISIIQNSRTKQGKLNQKAVDLLERLKTYSDYLLSLKILDLACGSGAFLNQSLEFLIEEHQFVDEYRRRLEKDSLGLFDIKKSILENNIYGVDINEESVEIAKLSLWLRTAERGKKLSDLSNNIKCGNSLIDNPEVAGEKSFKWEEEFLEIMANGGFDVVIGNPPYVRAETLGEIKNYLESVYQVYNPASDLFSYFYEKSFSLLNPSGLFSFISNTFNKTTAGKELRNFLRIKTQFLKYIDFTAVTVFEGATTYPIILVARNAFQKNNNFKYIKIPSNHTDKSIYIESHKETFVLQDSLQDENWTFHSVIETKMLDKIKAHKTIREIYGKTYRGILTGLNEAFITKNNLPLGIHIKPIYEGKELKKWSTPPSEQKLILFESNLTRNKYGSGITEEEALNLLKIYFPNIIEKLVPFEERAKKRYDKGEFWWELRNCAYYDLFEIPKIIFPNLQKSNKFSYDETGTYINAPAVFLPTGDKFLLSILNSKLVWYFLQSICVVRSGGFIEVKPQYFEQIPIPSISEEQKMNLTQLVENTITLTSKLQQKLRRFLNRLESNLNIEKFSQKLLTFYSFDFKTFLSELKRLKIKLSLSEQDEWEEHFDLYKSEINSLQAEIKQIENEIDQMVYELYGLSEEETQIVENSFEKSN